MSKIPDDIMQRARAVYMEQCHLGGTDPDWIEAIARALMEAAAKERERCAGLVDDIADRHRIAWVNCASEGHKTAAQFASYTASAIDAVAAAIRGAKP